MRWPEIEDDDHRPRWCPWELTIWGLVTLFVTAQLLIGGLHGCKKAAPAPQAGRVDGRWERSRVGDGQDLVPEDGAEDWALPGGSGGQDGLR